MKKFVSKVPFSTNSTNEQQVEQQKKELKLIFMRTRRAKRRYAMFYFLLYRLDPIGLVYGVGWTAVWVRVQFVRIVRKWKFAKHCLKKREGNENR